MEVEVRLFGVFRERAERDSVKVELQRGATVADALAALGHEPGLAEVVERMPTRVAVNHSYADESSPIAAGDELALIPPISGGTELRDRVSAEITAEPLAPERLRAAVTDSGAGAVVTFEGTTRDVPELHYEAYAEMAEPRIAAILAECVERHGLKAAAATHRVGVVPLSEPSVIVCVSAAHREEAFAGAREAIDRIKAEAPIWKKEITDSGEERWVEGTRPEADA